MFPAPTPELPLIYPPALCCQCWHHGRDRYRPAGEPINMDRHRVEAIEGATAKAFVILKYANSSCS